MSGWEETRTPGAGSGVDGECLFDLAAIECILAGPAGSGPAAEGIDGDRMVALMRLPAGSAAEACTHPDAQWIFVLEGVLDAVVGGENIQAGPGALVHVPAGVVHSGRAGSGRDVVFFAVKDTAQARPGIKAA